MLFCLCCSLFSREHGQMSWRMLTGYVRAVLHFPKQVISIGLFPAAEVLRLKTVLFRCLTTFLFADCLGEGYGGHRVLGKLF